MRLKTSKYKYGRYPFKEFNPVQSDVFKHLEKDRNIVVSSPTSSGKTIAGEIIGGKTLDAGKRVVYLSPIKALTEEKVQDWSSPKHPWYGRKVFVMTGDYKLTDAREKELLEAEVIICTYEMFAVRCRRFETEKNSWVQEIGCLIVDEAHFLGAESRGDHLENSLVLFTQRNSQARIIFLSATLINSKEIAEWLVKLNDKDTVTVYSDYRPCKLNVQFSTYEKPYGNRFHNYAKIEDIKISRVKTLIDQFPNDQWLIFVHTKNTGKKTKDFISGEFPTKICAFHSADLTKESRALIEHNFKSKKVHYLVATSTLAYGMNLPARRVAIVGVERGIMPVDPLDVIQECGRAGRPKYDTEGSAYVILADDEKTKWEDLLTHGVSVSSQIPKTLGFHLIGEIVEQRVKSVDSVAGWSDRLLASQQMSPEIFKSVVVDVFQDFIRHSLIEEVDWSEDTKAEYTATQLGKIASFHYFDPIEVAEWKQNLIFIKNIYEDIDISWMIGNTGRKGFIPKELRSYANDLTSGVRNSGMYFRSDAAIAKAIAVYGLLTGNEEIQRLAFSTCNGIRNDIERIISCLSSVDSWVLKNHRTKTYWDLVLHRILYSVGWNQARLCQIPGIGKTYSTMLVEEGITSLEQFYDRRKIVKATLPKKTYLKAIKYVREFLGEKKVESAKVSDSA